MQCNVGKKDKMIRYGLAIVALPLGYFVSPWFYIVTVAMALTAKLSFCGLYRVLGVNTCDHDHTKESAEKPLTENSNSEQTASPVEPAPMASQPEPSTDVTAPDAESEDMEKKM